MKSKVIIGVFFCFVFSLCAEKNTLDQIYFEKGKYYYIQRNLDKAIFYFKKSLEKNQKNQNSKSILLKIYSEKGRTYFEQTKYKQALKYFQEAEQLSSDNLSIADYIKKCKQFLGDDMSASISQSKIISVVKSKKYYELGSAKYLDGQYSKAIEYFKLSLHYNFKNDDAKRVLLKLYLQRATKYLAQKKYKLSLKYFKLSKTLSPENKNIDKMISKCENYLNK